MAVTYTSTYAGPGKFHGSTSDTDHPNYPEVLKHNDALSTDIQTALTAGFGANSGTLAASEASIAALEAKGLIVFAKGITAEDSSTGVTAGTNETAFTNKVTIPANTFAVGDRVRVHAKVSHVSNNSTDTVALVLAFAASGGLVASTCILSQVAAVDASSGSWLLTFEGRIIAIGAATTATIEGVGTSFKTGGTPAFLATELAAHTSVATNAIIDVGVTYVWSVSHADNVVRLVDLWVAVVRPSA